MYKTC